MKSLSNSGDKTEVLERLTRLKSDSHALWGKMNAHEMICHLNDSFKCATGEKTAVFVGNIFSRTVIKWMALKAPRQWPQGFKTRPEMDQHIGGTKPVEFEADRKELERMVERFTSNNHDFKWHWHPVFGDMTIEEWYRWGYLHMDHHLRQFGV